MRGRILAVTIVVVAVSVIGSVAIARSSMLAAAAGSTVSLSGGLTDAQVAAVYGPVPTYTHVTAVPAGVVPKITANEALSLAATAAPPGSSSATNPPTVVAAMYSIDSNAPAMALQGVTPGSRPVWLVEYHHVVLPNYGGHTIAGNKAPGPDYTVGKFTVVLDANTGDFIEAVGTHE